jgi:2-dehydro-3-deoxygluconokinase
MSKTVVTFGEIMGRLATPDHLRFRQALPGSLDVTFAGAEANVSASLALLGESVRFVTALPTHLVADACVGALRGLGIDTEAILRTDYGRLGLYFVELGANQRPSLVQYDRDGSAISMTPASSYDWKAIFADAAWFHTTGITPAISQDAFEAALAGVTAAKDQGLNVSCDLNFRKKLWRWKEGTEPKELARESMREVLPYVDLVIGNEEDAADVLDVHAEGSDVEAGKIDIQHYPDVARAIVERFANVKMVGITLRESISATHNNWGAMLYIAETDTAYFAPMYDGAYRPYQITGIVDRVGAGDSFGAGLIHSFLSEDLSAPEDAVAFATAASCLTHSISGDFNFSTRSEIEALMRGSGSGRVVR